MVRVLMALERLLALYRVGQMMSGWNQGFKMLEEREREGAAACDIILYMPNHSGENNDLRSCWTG